MTFIDLAEGECVALGAVILKAARVRAGYVSLGIVAPPGVSVVRPEAKRQTPKDRRAPQKEFCA